MSLRVSPEVREWLRQEAEKPLPVEQFMREIAEPISDRERGEVLSLVAWFTRRYPTAAERCAYSRRAWKRAERIRAGRWREE
jgi:hypothetical protein